MSEIPIAFNQSPCIGRCSTTYGDDVCRGCKRFLGEIASWGQYSLEQRASVWKRLDLLAQKVIHNFVKVQDAKKLEHYLNTRKIRYPKHQSTESWALHCLDNFQEQITELSEAGLTLIEDGRQFTTTKALRVGLQKRMYDLANAHKARQEQNPQPSR